MSSEAEGAVPVDALALLRKNVEDVQTSLYCEECLFRTLADHAPVGLYLDDTDGRAIYINRKCAELVGMPAEAALDFNWIETLHPEDTDRMVGAWQTAFQNSERFYEEYRWVHKDGTIVWTLGEVIPLFGGRWKSHAFCGDAHGYHRAQGGGTGPASLGGPVGAGPEDGLHWPAGWRGGPRL